MKNKFNKAREEATDATIEEEPKNEEKAKNEEEVSESNYPDKFKSFIEFAREKGIEDSAIFNAISQAMTQEPEEKAKNRKKTKGAFGGKNKQKSKK